MYVDFAYAFSVPHRLTVSLPNCSDKTLLDVYPDHIRMKWSYENLLDKPLASFSVPEVNWELQIRIEIDGHSVAESVWHRAGGWLPVLEKIYHDQELSVTMQIAASETAALVRYEMVNRDSKAHRVVIRCIKPGITASNPGWVQADWDRDVLLAAYRERADRILVFMVGGDEFLLEGPATLSQEWLLKPDEKKTGWIVRPYQAYHSQLPMLRKRDWQYEFQAAIEAWRSLIDRAAWISIPDSVVQNAFYAGLADCFVMREPVTDEFIAATPGTEKYRSASSGEPAIVAVLLDQVGLYSEAARGLQVCLEQQGEDGNWADPKGWAHYMWGISGFKAWAAMTHYRLTRDKAYLSAVYPRMLASSRWQEQQRAKTRLLENGKRPLTYGLMPRGMGDCGLMDGNDLHGVFLPHNILTVFADAQTVEAAKILNRSSDLAELNQIHQSGLDDLRQALAAGAIREAGYRWIPGVAGKTDGSRWGVMYACYPCDILPAHHELIDGTIRKIESNISPGGIPVNTGWLKDGLWVAIALDNLAEAQLHRGEADAAIKYLYATLNHGTPLFSWCEERGQEAGSTKCTGDLQHLWTPLAVSRFIRDALVMEEADTLHLARGSARQWLASGRTLAVRAMPTRYGVISYELSFNIRTNSVTGNLESKDQLLTNIFLHVRLPGKKRIKSLSNNTANAQLSADGQGIIWQNINGRIDFKALLE